VISVTELGRSITLKHHTQGLPVWLSKDRI